MTVGVQLMNDKLDRIAQKRIWTYWGLFAFLVVLYLLLRPSGWQGSTELHTLMDAVATVLAVTAGIIALVHFFANKSNIFLFVGTGFLGTGVLDGYHAVVTCSWFVTAFPTPPPSLIPWSWNASRIFLAVLMFLSWWTMRRERTLGERGAVSERTVFLSVGALTLATFLLFAFVPLPRAYYPELFLGRPEELTAAAFFLVALVGFYREGDWKTEAWSFWLILSSIVGFVTQALYMASSVTLFDAMFDSAHMLKIVSYICVLIGLLISMRGVFEQATEAEKRARLRTVELHSEIVRSVGVEAELSEHKELIEERLELSRREEAVHAKILKAFLTQDDDTVFNEVLNITLETLESEFGVVGYIDENGAMVVPTMTRHIWDKCQVPDKTIVFPKDSWGNSIWPRAMRQKKTLYSNEPSSLTPEGHVAITRNVAAPILDRGEAIGLLQVANKDSDYQAEDIKRLEIIAQHVAPILGARIQRDRNERERDRAEEKLERHREHLEELVGERTAELEAANKELEAFAYSVSHDLRGPLRAVDGFSRILLEEHGGQLDEEGFQLLGVVRDNAGLMAKLIDDLLELSRVGRQEMHIVSVNMDELVTHTLHELRQQQPECSCNPTVLELPPAIGDPRLLHQVWLNLLSNAMKFSANGETAKVTVHGAVEADEVVYHVSDSGAGFDMRYSDKLFGLFQRLHRQDEFEGTGVGLAIVKRIVERHGGRVWAEGKPNHGATFHFAMPVAGSVRE